MSQKRDYRKKTIRPLGEVANSNKTNLLSRTRCLRGETGL